MKKLNKKGIFFSLGAAMVLFMLFLTFQGWSRQEKQDRELLVDRAQLTVLDSLSREMDSEYLAQVMKTAAKPAVIALAGSAPMIPADLEEMMKTGASGIYTMDDGYTTDNNFDQAFGMLSFSVPDRALNYHITEIRQRRYDSFEIEFLVSYNFSHGGYTWEQSDKMIAVPISVYSIPHPAYAQAVIDTSWEQDPAAPTCLIGQLFISSTHCYGSPNIRPHIIIPPT